jgi:hypothetical protein
MPDKQMSTRDPPDPAESPECAEGRAASEHQQGEKDFKTVRNLPDENP